MVEGELTKLIAQCPQYRCVEGCEGVRIGYLVEVSVGQAHIHLENKDNREGENGIISIRELRCGHIFPAQDAVRKNLLTFE